MCRNSQKIATHSSSSAPGVSGFVIDTTRRTVINDELLKQWRSQEFLSSGQPWAIEKTIGLQFFQNFLPL